MNKLVVLISSYNGEKYIRALLDSLVNQTNNKFDIYIRDDGSTDSTIKILEDEYSNRVKLIKGDNIGSKASFYELVSLADNYEYYMFCDQDEIWEKYKVEVSLQALNDLDNSKPAMIYSDSLVVDSDLNVISDSFIKYQKLPPKIVNNWKNLVAQNVVQGCTICFNQETRKLFLDRKTDIVHHDHLVAVLTAKNGQVKYINKALVKYRQHTGNVLGSLNFNLRYVFNKILKIKDFFEQERQVAEFYEYSLLPLLIRKFFIGIYRFLYKGEEHDN